jgi:hypothetical protein
MRNEDFVENLDKEQGEKVDAPAPEVRKEDKVAETPAVVQPEVQKVDKSKDYELRFKFLSLDKK